MSWTRNLLFVFLLMGISSGKCRRISPSLNSVSSGEINNAKDDVRWLSVDVSIEGGRKLASYRLAYTEANKTDLFFDFESLNSREDGKSLSLMREEFRSTRQKRNVICSFGLKGVLVDAINRSLLDVRKNEPLELGDSDTLDLKKGKLFGLSSLHNVTALDVTCDGNLVMFVTTLALEYPVVTYSWSRRIIFLLEGDIYLKAKHAEFVLRISMDVSNNFRFQLDNTSMTKLEGFDFKFTGLGIFNFLVSGAVNLLEMLWQSRVMKCIEDAIHSELEKEISKISFSLR